MDFLRSWLPPGRKTVFISGQTAWDAQKRIVSALAVPDFLIEIEAIAVLD
jgi:enamine deaminase RidA (YjgF/YER057c/UK114 family)